MIDKDCDAAVLIVLGQSNAHGHGLTMREGDQITVPMKNVFGLNRALNQTPDLKEVTWSGYTTEGMNLGETQDHTYCLAEELAKMWQNEIDGGNQLDLPDLYVIQISIGAQGISLAKGEKNNMWYPYREERMVPGPLGTVDISLYPWTLKVLTLAMAQLRATKQHPSVIGVHWSAGNDCSLTVEQLSDLEAHYQTIFAGFRQAIGQDYTLYIQKLLHVDRAKDLGLTIDSMLFENALHRARAKADPAVKMISAADSPYWQAGVVGNGIYVADHVHYTEEVQRWFASVQFTQAISGRT